MYANICQWVDNISKILYQTLLLLALELIGSGKKHRSSDSWILEYIEHSGKE